MSPLAHMIATGLFCHTGIKEEERQPGSMWKSGSGIFRRKQREDPDPLPVTVDSLSFDIILDAHSRSQGHLCISSTHT